ncbi:K(+)/H(+) antiporter NhaP2 [wastewater metagenome]|uniref:K(+)/H(+) antiporter NhaP2 n=2 Tax=unclassified sequences TaxID=12908 RepID=A0A5B8R8B1_9ZZZZ|nr:sodium:proton antiporter [Arhodomonas sp. KWT]QEA04721.1 K(+)/H(+) antiporter NhaP2 [uncultured organism]
MSETITAALVGIGVLGVLAQWLAWRMQLPAILFLLAAGLLAGPGALGWIDPDALFGELLFPIISLAVAVILFEGGLTLRRHEIRGLGGPVNRLLTVGVAITWASTALAAWWLTALPWSMAVLFGAITVVTGPTVIVPLLRSVRPRERVGNVLRWEGIVIDPIGALIAVLAFEFILASAGERSLGATVLTFAAVLVVGTVAGALAGHALGIALREYWLPDYLHNVGVLVAVFAVYFVSNRIHHEAGLLSVTVMGIWLANMPRVPLDDILNFKESLSVLLISGLFILLAARLDPSALAALGWGAAGVLLVMQLIGRPLNVLVSTAGTPLDWRERALLAWIAPRGIVAAAVSAVFALRLQAASVAGAELLVPLTFLVIVFTVVLQSTTARPLAGWLDLREPAPRGVLIVGANRVARTVAAGLAAADVPVRLADANWDNVQDARMQGLDVYYGNPTSEHAERHLSMTGIGFLFGLSPRSDLNTLASLHFAKELGHHRVFRLPPGERDARLPGPLRQRHRHDNTLFGADATYGRLASLIGQGASVHVTGLTAQFDWPAYQAHHGGEIIPLCALDPAGTLHVFTGGDDPEPRPEWSVLALVEDGEASG